MDDCVELDNVERASFKKKENELYRKLVEHLFLTVYPKLYYYCINI